MIPVDQDILAANDDGTDANGVPGNCYQACLASIVEKPLANVPHIVSLPGDWWINVQAWAHHEGLMHTFLGADDDDRLTAIRQAGDVLGIIGAGPSPRGPFLHAVVLNPDTLQLAHDPHPSRKGLTETQAIEVIWRPHRVPLTHIDALPEGVAA